MHVSSYGVTQGINQQTRKIIGYKTGFSYSRASTSSLPSTSGLLSSRISVIRDWGIPVTIRSVSTTRLDIGFAALSCPFRERSTTENISQFPLQHKRRRYVIPMNARNMEKLQQTGEHGMIKRVIKLKVLISTHQHQHQSLLQIVNTVVVVAFILCQIGKDIIHKTFTENDRPHRIEKLRIILLQESLQHTKYNTRIGKKKARWCLEKGNESTEQH